MLERALLSLLIGFLTLPSGASTADAEPTGRALAEQVYHRNVGDDMQLQGTMTLISKNGHERVRQYYTLRLDQGDLRKVLIRFTAPADITGTGFLVIENSATDKTEQHLYLPALKRTRRIVASQQGRSFVNSDFTYEDMQRQPLDDWTYQLAATEQILGRTCYQLISIPKKSTDSQYSRIVSWIDQEYKVALQSHFYDDKERHSKSYRVEALQLIDGIATETEMVMEDHQDQHKTRLSISEVRYNTGIDERNLTTRALADW